MNNIELYQKSKLKYIGMIIQKNLIKVFYTWKSLMSPKFSIINRKKIENSLNFTVKNVVKSNLSLTSEVYAKKANLPKKVQKIVVTKESDKSPTSLFDELRASLQNKAQNLNYRKTIENSQEDVISYKDNQIIIDDDDFFTQKPRHHRSNTYSSSMNLAVVSSKKN